MSYWELDNQQIRSFKNWNPNFKTINGPSVLWSLSSTNDRLEGPPMYWMDNETFTNCIKNNSLSEFHELIRQCVALREDWGNELTWIYKLKIPKNESLTAWTGFSQAQQSAMKARRLQERIKEGLPLIFWGGVRQYIIDQRMEHTQSFISKPILATTHI